MTAVRKHMIDLLDPEELATLAVIAEKVVGQLEEDHS